MKKNKLEVALWKRFACIFAVIGITVITCLGFRNEETDVSPTPPATLPDDDTYEYISLDDACIAVNGFPWLESGKLNRLKPDTNYSTGVDKNAKCTAGGRIRFCTDSPSIHIWGKYGNIMVVPWFSDYGANGMDIYANGKWQLTLSPTDKEITGTLEIPNTSPPKMADIEIVLPNYASVEEIMIGVVPGSSIERPKPYTIQKPIVFYGSSITQGCAASRPSLTFPYCVAAYFDADFVNEGFSGSALGEQSVAVDIAEIDASAYVLEYDHNAETTEKLRATHYEFYSTIRAAHPETPIVLLSRISGGYSIGLEETSQRDAVIRSTYEKAVADGDKNIYFIDGCDISEGNAQMLADGTHPNDYGMQAIAAAVIQCLRESETFP